jgi:hypothetical protein
LDLARAVGIWRQTIQAYERADAVGSTGDVVRRLLAFFGPGLVWMDPPR